jgi:hypothetical protein
MESFSVKDQSTIAEIKWCFFTSFHHISNNVAGSASTYFKYMFPDSATAQDYKMEKDKLGYSLNFGLAPHFKSVLLEQINVADNIVVLFDESFNKVSKDQQMDLHIRFFDEEKSQVRTRYLTSIFLLRSRAADILKAFKEGILGIKLDRIFQVSMDGCNVNKKFLRDFQAELLENNPQMPTMIDIGTCGLHTIHNALKNAFNKIGWSMNSFLSSLYNMFYRAPARKSFFKEISLNDLEPAKFCAVRWVENKFVAEKALAVLPSIHRLVEAVESKKTKMFDNCDSYQNVAKCTKDLMMMAKVAFFQTVATDFQSFLVDFQTDKASAPFLYSSIKILIKNLLDRFMDKTYMKLHTDLTKIDYNDIKNYKPIIDLDIGFGTKSFLKYHKKVKESAIQKFKLECRKVLVHCVDHVIKKSPFRNKLCKGLSFLAPEIALNEHVGNQRLSLTLEVFVENGQITGAKADEVKRNYDAIIDKEINKQLFRQFDKNLERLEDL